MPLTSGDKSPSLDLLSQTMVQIALEDNWYSDRLKEIMERRRLCAIKYLNKSSNDEKRKAYLEGIAWCNNEIKDLLNIPR